MTRCTQHGRTIEQPTDEQETVHNEPLGEEEETAVLAVDTTEGATPQPRTPTPTRELSPCSDHKEHVSLKLTAQDFKTISEDYQ